MIKYILFFVVVLAIGAKAGDLYFPPIGQSEWATITPEESGFKPDAIDSLYKFLEENDSKAFILLRDGKIVLEKYFNSFTADSVWYWASAGKSLTSFAVGIAQADGLLNLDAPSSTYLGSGWSSCSEAEEQLITVRHHLSMSTGLDDRVEDNHCTLDSCLVCLAPAGTRWAYHNAPYTLLDGIIENATGQKLNTYINQKIKAPTGMTGVFVRIGYDNVFVSNARSMARFGLLVLSRGSWDGLPILSDTNYFRAMTNTSTDLNKSYGYLWWLNGKESYMMPTLQFVFDGPLFPNAPPDMISALGKNGQFLNIVPGKNLVWLRLGNAPESTEVPFRLNDQIWAYVNSLSSNTPAEEPTDESAIRIQTRIGGSLLVECTGNAPVQFGLYNTLGEKLIETEFVGSFETGRIGSGMYLARWREGSKIGTSKVMIIE